MAKFFQKDLRSRDIKTNGRAHNIRFDFGGGKYDLYVDGELRETFRPPSFLSTLMGDLADYPFWLDGARVVVAMRFGRMRVAVDGVYTDDGGEFREVLPLPNWGVIFVAAILLPPLILRSTFMDFLIALTLVYTCTHFLLKNPDLKFPMWKRVLYCVLVTIGSWLLLGFFTYASIGKI